LPTEAEWEYSCRGGATSYTVFHYGNTLTSLLANFQGYYPYPTGSPKGASLGRTTTVGSYKPNNFGLYDMHGNVWQWCADWYDAGYYKNSPRQDPENTNVASNRVLRGGSWINFGGICRSADRDRYSPGDRSLNLGFRVAAVQSLR